MRLHSRVDQRGLGHGADHRRSTPVSAMDGACHEQGSIPDDNRTSRFVRIELRVTRGSEDQIVVKVNSAQADTPAIAARLRHVAFPPGRPVGVGPQASLQVATGGPWCVVLHVQPRLLSTTFEVLMQN